MACINHSLNAFSQELLARANALHTEAEALRLSEKPDMLTYLNKINATRQQVRDLVRASLQMEKNIDDYLGMFARLAEVVDAGDSSVSVVEAILPNQN